MVLSIWRKAHLLFAITSAVFLLLLSITGVILSFAPISNTLSDSYISNSSTISVGEVIHILEEKYDEIFEINFTQDDFLKISVMTSEGEFATFYADPQTGEKLADIEEESVVFSFSRTLHRSLYAGAAGRIIVGVAAFLLLLIVFSGMVLIVKRQLGIKQFFGKIVKENVYQYSHVWLSRLSLFFIFIISFTGVYLSLEHFEFFTSKNIDHKIENGLESSQVSHHTFTIFKETPLSELQDLQFPFSNDPEDYFQMRSDDHDYIVNQFDGKIISKISVGVSHQFYQLMFSWHTGNGNLFWSVILCLAALNIPFFIFTGFRMTWDRRKGTKRKNTHEKDSSNIILLVGSEGGTTLVYAKQLQDRLVNRGYKVFLDDLNNYTRYESIEHLIVMTSTYGRGEAPVNANTFLKKFKKVKQPHSYQYAVLGFGSTDYPDFCKFAKDVDEKLDKNAEAKELIPLYKVNRREKEAYKSWVTQWAIAAGMSESLSIKDEALETKKTDFDVVENTIPTETIHQTFRLCLSGGNHSFQSGDLLAVAPLNEEERLYSIAKDKNGNLTLFIRKHELGVCSTYLSRLKVGEKIEARIQENTTFHYPKDAECIIGIGNGTGIGPLLGMVEENNKTDFHLFWGGKSRAIELLFGDQLTDAIEKGKLTSFCSAYSQQEGQVSQYVQDALVEKQDVLRKLASTYSKCYVMICGSLNMRDAVLETIKEINLSIDDDDIRSDCY